MYLYTHLFTKRLVERRQINIQSDQTKHRPNNSPIEEDICSEDRTHAQFSSDYPRGIVASIFSSFNIDTCSSV